MLFKTIYNSFKAHFPAYAEQIVTMYKVNDEFEIAFTLSDPDMSGICFYNIITETFTRKPIDVHNLTEKDWVWLFKRKLKNIMAYTHVTQLELSRRVGVSQVMMHKYIRGTAAPSSYKLYLIAESLGCSVKDLFYEFIEMEDTEWER